MRAGVADPLAQHAVRFAAASCATVENLEDGTGQEVGLGAGWGSQTTTF